MLQRLIFEISGEVLSVFDMPALLNFAGQHIPIYLVPSTTIAEIRLTDGRIVMVDVGVDVSPGRTCRLEETQWHICKRLMYSSFRFCR